MNTYEKICKFFETHKPNAGQKYWININTFTSLMDDCVAKDRQNASRSEKIFGPVEDNVWHRAYPEGTLNPITDRFTLQQGHFANLSVNNDRIAIFVGKGIPDDTVFVERIKPIAEAVSKNPQDVHAL